jgi:hypothetical protein
MPLLMQALLGLLALLLELPLLQSFYLLPPLVVQSRLLPLS